LPLFPLTTVLTPGMPLSLHIFEPRYRQLLADLLDAPVGEGAGAQAPEPVFGVVALVRGREVGDLGGVHEVGTVARITDVRRQPDGRADLAAIGQQRFTIAAIDARSRPYLVADVRYLDEPDGALTPSAAAAVLASLRNYRELLADLGAGYEAGGRLPSEAVELSYAVAQQPTIPMSDRQRILAAADTGERLAAARAVLWRERELVRLLRAVPADLAMFGASAGSRS